MREQLPVALEEAELDALLRAARESSPRDLALVCVMSYGGLRVSEAVSLQWRDVLEDRLFVRKGKGSKQRYVEMHWRVKEALSRVDKRYVLATQWVFPGRGGKGKLTRAAAYKIINRLCALAGVPPDKAHPHSLRHTFAVRLVRAKVDLVTIRDLLGHSSIAVTQIYLRLTNEHRRAAVDSLP